MTQQIIALIFIMFFLSRLYWQKQKKEINYNEFIFWLIFWHIVAGSIISLRWIDAFVARIGFSGSGIDVLLYVGIALLFYFIFKLRLRLAKIEKNITKIIRHIALKDK